MASKKNTTGHKKSDKRLRLGDEHWGIPLFEELQQAHYIVEAGDAPGARTLRTDDAGFPGRFRELFRARTGLDIRGTDADIRNAYELTEAIEEALCLQSPESSVVLRKAVEAVREKGGKGIQRVALLEATRSAVEKWKKGAPPDEVAFDLRLAFGLYNADAEQKDLALFRRELARSNKREATRIAAAIAVELRMWGDDDEEKSYSSFRDAERKSKG
jgi:hypothetical protein